MLGAQIAHDSGIGLPIRSNSSEVSCKTLWKASHTRLESADTHGCTRNRCRHTLCTHTP